MLIALILKAVARGLALSPLGIQVFIFSNSIPIQATNMVRQCPDRLLCNS